MNLTLYNVQKCSSDLRLKTFLTLSNGYYSTRPMELQFMIITLLGRFLVMYDSVMHMLN